ncbi:MAG: DUF541 domain-containing protein [Pedobacter sp.]|nr:MAG: DUF541 domain-containing protein [Pedobacter sp.]
MKKLLVIALLAISSVQSMAQIADLRKKISVSGTAEAEVTPDIIYITISLKEYFRDNNNKRLVNITDLENQLYNAVLKAGIPKENLMVNNISSYNYAQEKKKNPDYLASKQYKLKVSDLNKWNAIIAEIDAKAIAYTNIDSYDYSKKEELKMELKIKALREAKTKATTLVESIGEKLAGVIDIQEINNEYYPQPVYRANMMMAKTMSVGDAEMASAPELDFKKIKLTYVMNTVFEIR